MEKDMKNNYIYLFVFILLAVMLSACAAISPELSSEMIVSMTSYSSQDMEIVHFCANNPKGLYWHDETKIWAVVCKMEHKHTYGAVLMDTSYNILVVDHLNAKSMSELEKLVFSVGWQER